MTPAQKAATGARRAEIPAARVSRHRRRIRLVAACYLGMALLAALAVVMSRVLPAAFGVPAFVVLAVVVVVTAHPSLRITRRN